MAQRELQQFNVAKLEPYINPRSARTLAGQMAASLTVAKGDRLGQLTANGKYTPAVKTLITAPAAAPVPTAAGADGTLPAGDYLLAYTYVNANGETTISPVGTVTVGATNHIAVATLALPAGVDSINLYMTDADGNDFHLVDNYDGTGFNILAPASSPQEPPVTNTALLKTDGSQTAKVIAAYDFVTDTDGNVYLGSGITDFSSPMVDMQPTAILYHKGAFLKSELTGISAAEIADLGGKEMGAGAQAYIDIP